MPTCLAPVLIFFFCEADTILRHQVDTFGTAVSLIEKLQLVFLLCKFILQDMGTGRLTGPTGRTFDTPAVEKAPEKPRELQPASYSEKDTQRRSGGLSSTLAAEAVEFKKVWRSILSCQVVEARVSTTCPIPPMIH